MLCFLSSLKSCPDIYKTICRTINPVIVALFVDFQLSEICLYFLWNLAVSSQKSFMPIFRRQHSSGQFSSSFLADRFGQSWQKKELHASTHPCKHTQGIVEEEVLTEIPKSNRWRQLKLRHMGYPVRSDLAEQRTWQLPFWIAAVRRKFSPSLQRLTS